MLLPHSEYIKLLKANMSIFYFSGFYNEILRPSTSFNDFLAMRDLKILYKCREALYNEPELIDDFIGLNKHLLSQEDREILEDFNRFINTTFILYKCEKDYGVFIDVVTTKAYAVKALTEPFGDIVPGFPILVDAVIMPYKKLIVYDGLLKVTGSPDKVKDKELFTECERILKQTKIITSL
jgi:hypothetical protein